MSVAADERVPASDCLKCACAKKNPLLCPCGALHYSELADEVALLEQLEALRDALIAVTEVGDRSAVFVAQAALDAYPASRQDG